jgi:hypothetical protein
MKLNEIVTKGKNNFFDQSMWLAMLAYASEFGIADWSGDALMAWKSCTVYW